MADSTQLGALAFEQGSAPSALETAKSQTFGVLLGRIGISALSVLGLSAAETVMIAEHAVADDTQQLAVGVGESSGQDVTVVSLDTPDTRYKFTSTDGLDIAPFPVAWDPASPRAAVRVLPMCANGAQVDSQTHTAKIDLSQPNTFYGLNIQYYQNAKPIRERADLEIEVVNYDAHVEKRVEAGTPIGNMSTLFNLKPEDAKKDIHYELKVTDALGKITVVKGLMGTDCDANTKVQNQYVAERTPPPVGTVSAPTTTIKTTPPSRPTITTKVKSVAKRATTSKKSAKTTKKVTTLKR